MARESSSNAVDSGVVLRLRQVWCGLTTGHKGDHTLNVYEGNSWYQRCVCGWRSKGITISAHPPVPLSSRDIEEVHTQLLDAEMALHGGG
jgi:hypothetical protein